MLKRAWDWQGFREGLADEAIPIAGGLIGTSIGGIRGGAIGTALGGLGSIGYSKLRGEEISPQRKMLATGAVGLGLGGLGHKSIQHLTKGVAKAKPQGLVSRAFHPEVFNDGIKDVPLARKWLAQGVEDALPSIGGALGTGVAYASSDRKDIPKISMSGFFDELAKISHSGTI